MLNWSKEEWVDFGHGVGAVVASFLFFRLCQFVVRWYLFGKCTFRTFSYFAFRGQQDQSQTLSRDTNGLPQYKSQDLSVIPPNKKWRICNELISLIHSAVSGLWALYALLFFKELANNMIDYRCGVAISLLYLSGGYLLHDLLDLLINERSARIIELLFHHVVVLTGFAIAFVTGKFLGLVVFGLLMEVNSIFLHSRSLLNLYGTNKKETSFRIVALLNMITLLVFRVAVSAYLFYWMALHIWSMSWYLAIFVAFVILSLCTTNSVLAFRVMAADGLFGKSRARKAPNPNGGVDGVNEEEADEEEGEDLEGVTVRRADGEETRETLVDPARAPLA